MNSYFRWLGFVAIVSLALGATAQDEQSGSADSDAPVLEDQPITIQAAYWLNQAALAYDEQDYAGWARATEHLHGLRPYNQDFMTHLVRAYAQQGEYTLAYNLMLKMQKQGLAEDWDQYDELEGMHEHRLYEYLSRLMRDAAKPFGEAESFGLVPSDLPMPEAMARHPATGRIYIGTVRDGKILSSDNGRDWSELANPADVPELWSVFDLAIDAERGHLWVATAAVPQFRQYREADRGRSALLKLDLNSGELISVHRIIPDRQPHALGSLLVRDDGTVFAADTATPLIYRLEPDQRHPEAYFGHRDFSSLRGMALSADESMLYVADYEIGIFTLPTEAAGQARKLAVPEHLNEGGIDGLFWWDGYLVAIQNGISPTRLIRLKLSDDGLSVVENATLAAALAEFDVPTYGVLADNRLLFFGASHWHHVDARGRSRPGRLADIPLLSVEVDSSKVLAVGQEMIDEMIRRAEQHEAEQDAPPDNE